MESELLYDDSDDSLDDDNVYLLDDVDADLLETKDTFVVSDLEEAKIDKLTKEMNEIKVLVDNYKHVSGGNIMEIKRNFHLLCEDNRYIIDESHFLMKLEILINETIIVHENELFKQEEADLIKEESKLYQNQINEKRPQTINIKEFMKRMPMYKPIDDPFGRSTYKPHNDSFEEFKSHQKPQVRNRSTYKPLNIKDLNTVIYDNPLEIPNSKQSRVIYKDNEDHISVTSNDATFEKSNFKYGEGHTSVISNNDNYYQSDDDVLNINHNDQDHDDLKFFNFKQLAIEQDTSVVPDKSDNDDFNFEQQDTEETKNYLSLCDQYEEGKIYSLIHKKSPLTKESMDKLREEIERYEDF